MKKILSLLLALALCFGLCACSSEKTDEKAFREAMEQWPWLADEWHFPFSQEPVIVIREDGTIEYKGTSGTWGWDQQAGGDDRLIPLEVDLSNGAALYLEIQVEENCKTFMVQNSKTGEVLMPEFFISGFGGNEIRTYGETLEERTGADLLIGEWVSLVNGEGYSKDVSFMNIRDDGTCSLLGEEGLWAVPSSWHDDRIDYIVVKTAGGVYSVQLDSPQSSGYRTIFISNAEDESAETMAFEGSMNLRYPVVSQDHETEEGIPEVSAQLVKIEITMENWDQYFEFSTEEQWVENAFGEADRVWVKYGVAVKEEILPLLVFPEEDASVAFEFAFDKVRYDCDIDFGNRICTPHALIANSGSETCSGVFSSTASLIEPSRLVVWIGYTLSEFSVSHGQSWIDTCENIQMVRVKGNIYLNQ